ncbi:12213_t:CDS:2 [Acaulospora colombiana]|uniref:12213_t:CDS:1 n=1 Tax=Acaulospora colombiana TaxID=27376 RepID=A0ACA9KYK5_9GLOM|nr:12213_t:CDS:2 [Acaulospora colombiana]
MATLAHCDGGGDDGEVASKVEPSVGNSASNAPTFEELFGFDMGFVCRFENEAGIVVSGGLVVSDVLKEATGRGSKLTLNDKFN